MVYTANTAPQFANASQGPVDNLSTSRRKITRGLRCCTCGFVINLKAANAIGMRCRQAMAYLFHENELPSLISEVPGRERIFFVNQELANLDDMLAGVMHYKKGAASPYHLHKNCEHFYFIINGKAQVETEEGIRPVGPGDMIFIPAEEKHRLRALEPLFYFEWQAPNRFKTTILEGSDADLRWNKKDGKVWVQT
jgi:mannose-6-phosphate isomerase-like protein (cupin superfamily)